MILDVGCGAVHRGDINVDKYRHSYQFGRNREELLKGVDTDPDVLAIGEQLPFRNNIFDLVLSHHVIEHSHDPDLFLRELVRVSKDEIEIHCPSRWSNQAKLPGYHVSYIKRSWLINSFVRLGCKILISKITLIPQRLFLCFYMLRQHELIVNATKDHSRVISDRHQEPSSLLY